MPPLEHGLEGGLQGRLQGSAFPEILSINNYPPKLETLNNWNLENLKNLCTINNIYITAKGYLFKCIDILHWLFE